MSSSGYPALTLASCMAREIAFFWSVVLPALIVTVNNGIRALPIMKGRGTNPGQSESLYQRNDPTLHNLACYLCLAGYDFWWEAQFPRKLNLDFASGLRRNRRRCRQGRFSQ